MNYFEELADLLKKSGQNSKGQVVAMLEEISLDDCYRIRQDVNKMIKIKRANGERLKDSKALAILKSYIPLKAQVDILSSHCDKLSNFVKGPQYDGLHNKSNSDNPVEKQHIKLIESKQLLEKKMIELNDTLLLCMDILNRGIPDSRIRYVLTCLYLENKNLYRIQIDSPFEASYKTIWRLKNEGLTLLAQMEFDDGKN